MFFKRIKMYPNVTGYDQYYKKMSNQYFGT